MAVIQWVLNGDNFRRATRYIEEMYKAEQRHDRAAFEEYQERFRALPGFPQHMDPNEDGVEIVERNRKVRVHVRVPTPVKRETVH
jgi:hypothetical protein